VIDYNFLSDFTGLYSSDANGAKYTASTYSHDWDFLNVSTTIALETTHLKSADRYVLSLRNSNVEEYTFQSPIIEIPNAVLVKDFVFHAMFYCSYPASVQIFLYNWDNDHGSVEPITTTLSAGEWTACFSNVFKFEDENEPTAHARVRIVISNHTSQIVRFTMPHLVYDKPFLDNTFYTYGKQFFPDVYYEIDSQQANPTFPFMKLWHSLTSVAEGAMKEYIKILPTEDSELSVELKAQVDSPVYNQFKSSLTNTDIIDDNYVQWASMFIGKLINSGIYITEDLDINARVTYSIGDLGPGGGKIFITPSTLGNSTGKYFETLGWGGYGLWTDVDNIYSSFPFAQAIGTGYQNTQDLIAFGPSGYNTIESFFVPFEYGGYDDWFCPSIDELEALHAVQDSLDVLIFPGDYWSSSQSEEAGPWAYGKDFGGSNFTQNYQKDNTLSLMPVRMFEAPTVPFTIPREGAQQQVLADSPDFRRRQISTRMYGMGSGTRASLKNAARAVIGEEAAVLVSPLWQGDEWSIMVRTLTASTPGVTGSGQSSSAVYASLELAKPAGYTLLHSTLDEITFVLDDNDFGVFDQSELG
jgi:hypothetical protein